MRLLRRFKIANFRTRPTGQKYPISPASQEEPYVPDAVKVLDSATPDRIRDIAFGRVAPQTVSEASEAIKYLEARKQAGIEAETEQKRAQLAFEAGTGTLAHVRRVARNIPQYSTRAQIELERRARRAIGGTVRGLFRTARDIAFGESEPLPVYPPVEPTLAQQATAEIQRRRRSGRPQTA